MTITFLLLYYKFFRKEVVYIYRKSKYKREFSWLMYFFLYATIKSVFYQSIYLTKTDIYIWQYFLWWVHFSLFNCYQFFHHNAISLFYQSSSLLALHFSSPTTNKVGILTNPWIRNSYKVFPCNDKCLRGGGEVETYLVAKPNLVHNLGFTMYPVLYYIITFSEVLTHILT